LAWRTRCGPSAGRAAAPDSSGEESPGSMETRCRITSGGADEALGTVPQKANRLGEAFGRRGKGERVR